MLIREVILFTNNVQKQKEFYQDVLDFELIVNCNDVISFNTGSSILTFQYQKEFKPGHVAFNIPSNQIEEALTWLQKRVEILPDGDKPISDFKSWNAKAIYFYDADNNIMEFIARKQLNFNTEKAFSAQSILSISEVAIASEKLEAIYNSISKIKKIPIFDGDLSRFCALGNDEGLFILVNKLIKKWHPTQELIQTSDFIIKGDYNFKFIDGKIET